jgi:hypothetical protein
MPQHAQSRATLHKSRGSGRLCLGWDARRGLQAIAVAMGQKRNAADRPNRGCAGREDLCSVAPGEYEGMLDVDEKLVEGLVQASHAVANALHT